MHKSDKDKELWLRLKSGDRSAFEEIYRNEIKDLINYGRRFSQELDLIEDCVHDLFVYIWSRRDSLSETDSIRKYLLVAFRHRIINTMTRLKKVSYNEPDENQFESDGSIEMDIIEEEGQVEKKKQLASAYHVLSKRQKEAIFLK